MRSSVIAAMIAAAMTSGRRAAPAGGIVVSGAVVTAGLFPNLGGGGNDFTIVPDPRVRPGVLVQDDTEIAAACRACDRARYPPPELNATLAVLLHELIQQNHGRNRIHTIFRAFPRHQRTPGAAGLRCHPVR